MSKGNRSFHKFKCLIENSFVIVGFTSFIFYATFKIISKLSKMWGLIMTVKMIQTNIVKTYADKNIQNKNRK